MQQLGHGRKLFLQDRKNVFFGQILPIGIIHHDSQVKMENGKKSSNLKSEI
jgi:hypothetical protein